MKLKEILEKLPKELVFDYRLTEDNLEVKGIELNSKNIKNGYLFAALKGEKFDGFNFIDNAIQLGANCILTHKSNNIRQKEVSYIRSDSPRLLLSKIAAIFFAPQPDRIIAVTGTNGKTSVAQFCRQIWEQLERPAASLGTLGIDAPTVGITKQGDVTTPDTISLHKNLKYLASKNCKALVLEASSHGLDQYRLHGVKLQAAAFTNLSHDHLDYHKDMEEYFQAKMRLFTEILPPTAIAVINADIKEYERIKGLCAGRKIISYSTRGKKASLSVKERKPLPTGQQVKLEYNGLAYDFFFPFVGEFQLSNALCAAGLILAEKSINAERVLSMLQTLSPIRGRMEFIGTAANSSAAVYVDFAHTPDALEQVLKALMPHTSGRLIALIGCGGDRDAKKRPKMGEIAAKYAHITIVSDDNPRSENPDKIREEIIKNCPNAKNIGNRKEAIEYGINMLQNGDIFVITGKGHEQGQKIGNKILPFDDATVAIDSLFMLETGTNVKI